MSGAMPPFPQYAFMAWCLVKHRDNFILLYYLYVQLLSNPISHEAQIKLRSGSSNMNFYWYVECMLTYKEG